MKSKRFLSVAIILACLILLFVGCSSGDKNSFEKTISSDEYAAVCGDYQAVGNEVDGEDYVGTYWHLTICEMDGEDGQVPYLTIYDNAAGNPGIEGKIVGLHDQTIMIEYDPDYYEELPSAHWEVSGKYLELTYEQSESGITLTNHDYGIVFEKDIED